MARLRNLTPEEQAAHDRDLSTWLEGKPQVIRDVVASHPPDRLYRLASTGHRVTLLSYGEDRTVCVSVRGEYNLVTFDRNVFGVSVDDLTECDLPGDDEPLGSVLTEDEVRDALAGGGTADERIAAIHRAARERVGRVAAAHRGASS